MPDETLRRSPRQLIVQTGLHPNPGPTQVYMGPLAGRGGFDDSQGWTQEEDDTLEEEMAGGPDFAGTHAKIDDGGGVWECLFPDEQQHSAQSARSVAAPTSADERPEVWEQMRTEWIEDGEKEYLESIGCPRVGHSIQPLLRRRRRKNWLTSTFAIVITSTELTPTSE